MTATQTQEFDFSLPQQEEVFIGREKELEEILNALKDGKNILIFGPEDVGKKSLAIKAVQICNEVKQDEKKPLFISLEQLPLNEDFFLSEETIDQIFKRASIVIVNVPNLLFSYKEKIGSDFANENSAKIKRLTIRILALYIHIAKHNNISLIFSIQAETPLYDEVTMEKFKTSPDVLLVELKGFSNEETQRFFSLRGFNLKQEELEAVIYMTNGQIRSLNIICESLEYIRDAINPFVIWLKENDNNFEKLLTFLKTLEKKDMSFFRLALEDPTVLFQLYLDRLITTVTDKKITDSTLNIYHFLGKQYFRSKNYKKALNVLLRVRSLAKEYKELKPLALTLLQLGHTYKTIGSLYRARLAYKDALRMFQQLKDESNIAETSASLAALEILQGRTTDARKHLSQARQYFETEGKPKAVQKMDDLFEAADYVDGAQMVQGRSDGVLV